MTHHSHHTGQTSENDIAFSETLDLHRMEERVTVRSRPRRAC